MSAKNGLDCEGSEFPRLVLADISDPQDKDAIDAFVRALIGNDAPLSPSTGSRR